MNWWNSCLAGEKKQHVYWRRNMFECSNPEPTVEFSCEQAAIQESWSAQREQRNRKSEQSLYQRWRWTEIWHRWQQESLQSSVSTVNQALCSAAALPLSMVLTGRIAQLTGFQFDRGEAEHCLHFLNEQWGCIIFISKNVLQKMGTRSLTRFHLQLLQVALVRNWSQMRAECRNSLFLDCSSKSLKGRRIKA